MTSVLRRGYSWAPTQADTTINFLYFVSAETNIIEIRIYTLFMAVISRAVSISLTYPSVPYVYSRHSFAISTFGASTSFGAAARRREQGRPPSISGGPELMFAVCL
jgi:hypothetical protein